MLITTTNEKKMKQPLFLFVGIIITLTASSYSIATPKQSNQDEVKTALDLTPNIENGKKLYRNCALCHSPEGWGNPSGRFPQIAGQHQKVIIKQLADIRSKNRDNPTMYPFARSTYLKGPQAMADMAAYVSKLPMVPNNTVGSGDDLKKGKKIFDDNCTKCHGDKGEGHNDDYYPRIQGQHYEYLLRQMLWIKSGKRRNADKKMVKQIEGFSEADLAAVADYTSRLKPEKSLLADHKDWRNPDFRKNFRTAPQVQKELNDIK
ncbi:MAG: c-type cytochrome [Cocleimonas sp.]|nr:c-type cytochrome [Cocleimonas sp.]